MLSLKEIQSAVFQAISSIFFFYENRKRLKPHDLKSIIHSCIDTIIKNAKIIYRMEESVIPPDNTFYYTVRIITTRQFIFGIYISCNPAISLQRKSVPAIICHTLCCTVYGRGVHFTAFQLQVTQALKLLTLLVEIGCCRKNLFKQSIDCFFDQLFCKIDS